MELLQKSPERTLSAREYKKEKLRTLREKGKRLLEEAEIIIKKIGYDDIGFKDRLIRKSNKFKSSLRAEDIAPIQKAGDELCSLLKPFKATASSEKDKMQAKEKEKDQPPSLLSQEETPNKDYQPLNREVGETIWNEIVQHYRTNRPSLEDFAEEDAYTPAEIKQDNQAIVKKEKNNTSTPYAEEAEVLIGRSISQIGWLGSETHFIQTTKFDDYFHGTDGVLEIPQENNTNKSIRIAVDITTSEIILAGDMHQKKSGLQGKIDNIIDGIQREQLAEIKYFKSNREPNFRGQLNQVPKIILGISREGVRNLMRKTADTLTGDITSKQQANKELRTDYLQIQLLRMAYNQLINQCVYTCRFFLKKIEHLIPLTTRDLYKRDKIKNKEYLEKSLDLATLLNNIIKEDFETKSIEELTNFLKKNQAVFSSLAEEYKVYNLSSTTEKQIEAWQAISKILQKKEGDRSIQKPDSPSYDETINFLTEKIWQENKEPISLPNSFLLGEKAK